METGKTLSTAKPHSPVAVTQEQAHRTSLRPVQAHPASILPSPTPVFPLKSGVPRQLGERGVLRRAPLSLWKRNSVGKGGKAGCSYAGQS